MSHLTSPSDTESGKAGTLTISMLKSTVDDLKYLMSWQHTVLLLLKQNQIDELMLIAE